MISQICLGVLLLFNTVHSQSIQDIIKTTPALSRLNEYINRLPVYKLLHQGNQQFTFLAPNNSAFLNIPAQVQFELRSSSSSSQSNSDNMFMYHLMPQTLNRGQLSTDGMQLSDARDAPPLYFRTINGKTFVNGAQLGQEIVAANGIVHIIDTVLHETALGTSAMSYMANIANRAPSDNFPSAKKFYNLLEHYRDENGDKWRDLNGHATVTLFVPTDDYMNRLSSQILTQIRNSKPIMKRVVDAHIISGSDRNDVGAVYHSRLLSDMATSAAPGIPAGDGVIKPKKFADTLYISNNCAQGQVVKANITVGNGVIHMIDGMLGYLPHDIYKYLEVNGNTLSRFYALVGMANMGEMLSVPNQGVSDVPATDKYTVFAPTNEAFSDVPDSRSLTQNRTLLDMVIKMHLLQKPLSALDITNNTVVETLAPVRPGDPKIKAKFYREGENIIVEVDHVRGRIVRADTCVKNGIIHYVDHVLGVPYHNLFEALSKDDRLVDMVSILRIVGLDQGLKNPSRRFTLFVPYNKAIAEMRQRDIGRQFLDSQEPYRLEAFLRRHMVLGEVFLDEIPIGSSKVFKTEAPGVEIAVEHSPNQKFYVKYGTKSIEVVERDMRMLNGVVNFINGTIYTEDPRDLQQISTASLPAFSALVLFVSLLVLRC